MNSLIYYYGFKKVKGTGPLDPGANRSLDPKQKAQPKSLVFQSINTAGLTQF